MNWLIKDRKKTNVWWNYIFNEQWYIQWSIYSLILIEKHLYIYILYVFCSQITYKVQWLYCARHDDCIWSSHSYFIYWSHSTLLTTVTTKSLCWFDLMNGSGMLYIANEMNIDKMWIDVLKKRYKKHKQYDP